jgi:hypothetical protein
MRISSGKSSRLGAHRTITPVAAEADPVHRSEGLYPQATNNTADAVVAPGIRPGTIVNASRCFGPHRTDMPAVERFALPRSAAPTRAARA